MAINFESRRTIRTIFEDTSLKSMFQRKFNMEMAGVMASRSPEIKKYIKDIFEIISETPRLTNIYKGINLQTHIKTKRKKRLSLKELESRKLDRGFQSENDRAMIYVNKLENLVARLQRRGQEELVTDEEARTIISGVRLFDRKVSKILKDSRTRKKVKKNLEK